MSKRLAMAVLVAAICGIAGGAGLVSKVEHWTPGGPHIEPQWTAASLLERFVAPDIPGASRDHVVAFAEPIYDRRKGFTGKHKPAVPTLRCRPRSPVLELDFGTLDVGCYCVRVIAIARTEDIQQVRRPVYLELTVNDAIGGGTTRYRRRVSTIDEFYMFDEISFAAPEKRHYTARLCVGEGSVVDIFIHSIELHDALHGTSARPTKRAATLFSPEERERLRRLKAEEAARAPRRRTPKPPLSPDERAQRDRNIWAAFPPINTQFVPEYDFRPGDVPHEWNGLSRDELKKRFGTWDVPGRTSRGWDQPLVLVNKTLGLTYSLDDLKAHRPLPDPYPFKDDGGGVTLPKGAKDGSPSYFMPIGAALGYRYEAVWNPLSTYHGNQLGELPRRYHETADREAAHDAALLLCRWAYQYPSFNAIQYLPLGMMIPNPGYYNRDLRFRRRLHRMGTGRELTQIEHFAEAYDILFDFIAGNHAFAKSVGRFIPWVRTEADVRRLVEQWLLGVGARRLMTLDVNTSKGGPSTLLKLAVVQQDRATTEPWLRWLFTRAYIYPHPLESIENLLSTTTTRDGSTYIGSWFYTSSGSPNLDIPALTRRYVAGGGDPRYDLSDLRRNPKMLASFHFPIDSLVAGGYPLSIGDVSHPAGPRVFRWMGGFEETFRLGWQWTHEPKFAWLVHRYWGRRGETDAEWAALETAAKGLRHPWLGQRPRVLPWWAGILESGQRSDDYRFKRCAFVRVGTGHGHSHPDTLDLQLIAHGVRLMNDLGERGRPGIYPGTKLSYVHNLVEVDGMEHPRNASWAGHGWISTFKPAAGAQFLHASTVRPPLERFERSVALIDVDAGTPPKAPPSTPVERLDTVHDPDVVTPNSYVFDVFRVGGGTWHTWCFHGNYSDGFEVNVAERTAVGGGYEASHGGLDPSPDAKYLRKFADGNGLKWAGTAPDALVATWRLRRQAGTARAFDPYKGHAVECRQTNAEKAMLERDYREDAPRKFTRVHLPGHGGERVLVAQHFSITGSNAFPCLFVQKRGAEPGQQSVYPAVIEPYVGEPVITSVKPLAVKGGAADASRPVALEVRTRNGRRDVCFSACDPTRLHEVEGGTQAAGQFAYTSHDAAGLRMLHLVHGRELACPEVRVRAEQAELRARITKVDYLERKVWVDARLPGALLAGQQFEIGNEKHRTSFRVDAIDDAGDGSVLTLAKSADLCRTQVVAVDEEKSIVAAKLGLDVYPGMDAGLTATNAAMDTFWRCRVQQGKPMRYTLAGAPVSRKAFPEGSVLCIWEFGPGDQVRIPTHVQLRREGKGYIVRADTAVTLHVARTGATLAISTADLAASKGEVSVQLTP